MMQLTNKRFQILTENGFKDFDGVIQKFAPNYIEIGFSDNTKLLCSHNHLIKINNRFIRANNLKPKQIIGNKGVVYIKHIDAPIALYDAINVRDTNSYYTNGIISHNCQFQGSAQTLVDGKFIATIPYMNPIAEKNGLCVFKKPEFDHRYCITVDVARGRGLDYSAFIVYDISKMPYEVVCTYKNNKISPIDYPTLLNEIGRKYNEAILCIESNDIGESIANELWYNIEYDNMIWTKNEEIANNGFVGVRTTKSLKRKGCATIKEIIEGGQLIINDYRIIEELNGYVAQKGSYSAQDTSINDDLCSCLFIFGWLTNQTYFEDISGNNTTDKLMESFREEVDDYVPTIFYDDGQPDTNSYSLSQGQIELLR